MSLMLVQDIVALFSLFILFLCIRHHIRSKYCAIADIPGPPSPSWLSGHMFPLLLSYPYGTEEWKWQKTYGMVYRIRAPFGEDRLMISDPKALRRIENHTEDFGRSPRQQLLAWMLMGPHNIFYVQGHDHFRVRNPLMQAFSSAHVKTLVPVFRTIVHKVIDLWEVNTSEDAYALVDVYKKINDISFDAIGDGVIGHPFNAVEDAHSKLADSHYNLIASASSTSKASVMSYAFAQLIPEEIVKLFEGFPTPPFSILKQFKDASEQLVFQLLDSKIDAIDIGADENKNLLSVVVDINRGGKGDLKLTNAEIRDQVRAMMVAGQDTTANTLAWALLELAKHTEWQEKVRNEIVASGGSLDYTELENLKYLNAHLKEILRLYPELPLTERTALVDAVIPLSEPIITTGGKEVTEIPVKKGQVVYCATGSYNRNTSIWGPDAEEFIPMRWLDGRTIVSNSLGPYANLASFLTGPRTCPGWRFAILEMQVSISELLKKFIFSVPSHVKVRPSLATTLIPVTADGTTQMPLIVTRLE